MSSIAYRPSTEALGRFPARLSGNDLRATQYIPATDLPEMVKVALSEGCDLNIVFQYISEEKEQLQTTLENGALVSRGARTGRVYKIELKIPPQSDATVLVSKIHETARLLSGGDEPDKGASPSNGVRWFRQKVAASALSDFDSHAGRLSFAG